MRILGHRGASADFPENTVEAFVGAMSQGADGVELDVMQCHTGELVVCHDENLLRLSGRNLRVQSLPWSELKTVDVGSTLGFRAARIPLLDEVADALPPEALLNIEIKIERWLDGGLTEKVARWVLRRGVQGRAWLSSFQPGVLLRLRQNFPSLTAGYLMDPDRPRWFQDQVVAPLMGTAWIHPPHAWIDEESMRRWTARGQRCATWTVDDPLEAARLRALGVEVVISNVPQSLRRALEGSND